MVKLSLTVHAAHRLPPQIWRLDGPFVTESNSPNLLWGVVKRLNPSTVVNGYNFLDFFEIVQTRFMNYRHGAMRVVTLGGEAISGDPDKSLGRVKEWILQ